MCSFEHNFPLVHPMWCVSTRLYQLRDVTTCKFSLKRRISALVWLTWTPPCATFDICGHVWAESFHCFAHCERTMRCAYSKTTSVYISFRLTKTYICVTINITLCFPPTFPSIYLNSHTTMRLFVKRWIQRRVRKLKSCGGTSFRLRMWVVKWKRWCHMLNVTHRHVFVSQKVRSFCSVRTCAWTRIVGDTFVWKRGSRDKTWEIRWQVTYRHVLLCEKLHTNTTL